MFTMKNYYLPEDIEPIVQQFWYTKEIYKVVEDPNKEKYYCLSMLPYPSGNLHIGHVRNYTIGDVIARYQRMLGKNVLHPMGWDAFGLPAENAAIKNNVTPTNWTYANINYMRTQLKLLGFSYDWSREITTCHSDYYKWEQWFFIQLYKNKLVYKKQSLVNWCPKEQTVLANEQVIHGCCWRCNTPVKYKEIPQWFIKITAYAEELLNDLNKLDNWPEQVKTMQRNWIGRSEGIEVIFKLKDKQETITIYTTRPDTFMGITYIAIAANHPIIKNSKLNNQKITSFIQECYIWRSNVEDISKIEKKGILLTNTYAIHPFTGELLPIWITNFVMMEYATGAVIGVPGHNQLDWEFAHKYSLPMKSVILNADGSRPNLNTQAMTSKGILFNSGQFNGLDYQSACIKITNVLVMYGIAKKKVYYRLRDWVISRQRYWGVPIPMITLENGDIFPIPNEQLPLILPKEVILDRISNQLKIDSNWRITTYNGKPALRETDTLDTFVESSWYYARYTCPKYQSGMLSIPATNYWLPVDQYIGGIEHAIMHLMYFRFYHKLMRDTGLLTSDEPVKRLLCQGMVVTDTFYYFTNNREQVWVSPNNVNIQRDKKGNIIKSYDIAGRSLIYAGKSKMSKSKNNGIDPTLMVKKYGADTVRLFIMFAAPTEATLEWHESGIHGIQRFLKRVWKLFYEHIKNNVIEDIDFSSLDTKSRSLRCEVYRTLIKVTDDISRRQTFNTAIAAIMKLTNKLVQLKIKSQQEKAVLQEALIIIIKMLYPFTPHICFYLWQIFDNQTIIDYISWPAIDYNAIIEDTSVVIIQINGKLRGKITLPKNTAKALAYKLIINDQSISKYLKNAIIHKVIYIPNKLLNFVIN